MLGLLHPDLRPTFILQVCSDEWIIAFIKNPNSWSLRITINFLKLLHFRFDIFVHPFSPLLEIWGLGIIDPRSCMQRSALQTYIVGISESCNNAPISCGYSSHSHITGPTFNLFRPSSFHLFIFHEASANRYTILFSKTSEWQLNAVWYAPAPNKQL